eukprot:SAG31_NODE_45304_length_259_cov_0.956250_1_plen_54_part_10
MSMSRVLVRSVLQQPDLLEAVLFPVHEMQRHSRLCTNDMIALAITSKLLLRLVS